MMALTSLYRDEEYAFLKRTDFLPMFVVFLAMASLGANSPNAGKRALLASVLALIIVWQLASGLAWRKREVESYETLDMTVLRARLPGYHGLPRAGSFLRHVRELRRQHPHACSYVFDSSEVRYGRWNPDLPAVMWSELPNHYVIATVHV